MRPMMDVLLKVHDAGEALVDVVSLGHKDLPEQIAAVVLQFSTSVVCIEVDPTTIRSS